MKKGAFKGIKIQEALSQPAQEVFRPPEFEANPVPEDDTNPYFKRHKGEEEYSDQLSKLCDKSIKSFLSGNIENFQDYHKELIYLKSKQPVIYLDDTHQPEIHRVIYWRSLTVTQ